MIPLFGCLYLIDRRHIVLMKIHLGIWTSPALGLYVHIMCEL